MYREIFRIIVLVTMIFSLGSCKMIHFYENMSMKIMKFEEHRFTTSDGIEIAYVDNGKDAEETLFFIHGYMADRGTSYPLAGKFRRDNYRIIAVDVPGFGASSKDLDKNYYTSLQAARLTELVRHLKLKKVHIIGASMGAAIAATLNPLIQDVTLSNTLVSPYGMPLSTERSPGVLKHYIKTGENLFLMQDPYVKRRANKLSRYGSNVPSIFMPFFIKAEINQRFKENRENFAKTGEDFLYDFEQVKRFLRENDEYRKRVEEYGLDVNDPNLSKMDFVKVLAQSIDKQPSEIDPLGKHFESIIPSLEKIENKVLVVWGSKDNIIDATTMNQMKPYIKDGEYLLIKGGSHGVYMFKKGKIAKAMRKYSLN